MLEKVRQYFIFGGYGLKFYTLAILTGILSSLVIIAFHLVVDYGHILISPAKQTESFQLLPWYWLLLMPICGGLLIGLVLSQLKPEQRQTGITHVIERLASHEGRLPWKNALLQFFGAAVGLITGHSIGREGPTVHLGATSGSQLATTLELPNSSVRILVACGTASAISASFNTPIAGVIFAMEVVMMEYHIASFMPVILASVTGALLSRITFGGDAIFSGLSANMQSLWELPYIVLMGIIIGLLAVLFIRSLRFFTEQLKQHPIWLRTSYAGILVGLGGLLMPEVMGMSYNAISAETLQQFSLIALVTLMLLKLFLSTACVGLGIPGGLIGPSLVIGACAGASLGMLGGQVFPDHASSVVFYAVLGMCAMMAATLKAPLAALMALLELTGNPNMIMPGMIAIVFASVINHDLFKNDALFIKLLKYRGLDYRNDPITQTLRRINIANAMQRNFVIMSKTISHDAAIHALAANPEWILIKNDKTTLALMPAADLAREVSQDEKENAEDDEIDLMQIPGTRRNVHKISLHASLIEAAKVLNEQHAEALYVTRMTAPMIERTYGVITKEMVESHYQLPISVKNKKTVVKK